ncbi:MAG: hypothetical protein QM622_00015 [Microbacterium sp.]|uniref:hypothetical protein n=1 Tax=Microbacterium sp. TaxID=51671 RepID=UPI0039E5F100
MSMQAYDRPEIGSWPPARMPSAEPDRLAAALFAPPARWGWAAAPEPEPVPDPGLRPEPPQPWTEPPRPHDPVLHRERAKAVSRLLRRIVFAVLAVACYLAYEVVIVDQVQIAGPQAMDVFRIVVLLVAGMLSIGVIRAIFGVRRASKAIEAFEEPSRRAAADARRRHEQAVQQWQQAQSRFEAAQAAAREAAHRFEHGPRWHPVAPRTPPARVDVIGGDRGRRGWSSLLATMGSTELAAGNRITLLDFTGDGVGDRLVGLASSAGLTTRIAPLGEGGADLDLLGAVATNQLPGCVADALAARGESADLRHERALIRHVLQLVLDGLEGPVTLGRLAAGVQVLRQGIAIASLTPTEVTRIAAHVGDLDANEWTARQLRYVADQLAALAALTAAAPRSYPLWSQEAVSVVATIGARDDVKDTLDRLLLHLAQHALGTPAGPQGVVVLAGADRFGAAPLQVFAEHARRAGVRLVIMIEQAGGELERFLGTGGAVCILRQDNHKDAQLAAEFVGRDHRFVLNQTSTQSGTTWSESGGDSFGASTNDGFSARVRLSGVPGRNTGNSTGRGHNWGTNRGWSVAENAGSSESRARVYEFLVEPNTLMAMADTVFLLVDGSGGRRRVSLADADPEIAVRDRVSTVPWEES